MLAKLEGRIAAEGRSSKKGIDRSSVTRRLIARAHYHIRWSSKEVMDWEAHAPGTEAETRLEQSSRHTWIFGSGCLAG